MSIIILALDYIAFQMQVIYRIKLPGPAILGEGKPENQNHAIIFTRGEGLQTIDMNQVNLISMATYHLLAVCSSQVVSPCFHICRITTWKKP